MGAKWTTDSQETFLTNYWQKYVDARLAKKLHAFWPIVTSGFFGQWAIVLGDDEKAIPDAFKLKMNRGIQQIKDWYRNRWDSLYIKPNGITPKPRETKSMEIEAFSVLYNESDIKPVLDQRIAERLSKLNDPEWSSNLILFDEINPSYPIDPAPPAVDEVSIQPKLDRGELMALRRSVTHDLFAACSDEAKARVTQYMEEDYAKKNAMKEQGNASARTPNDYSRAIDGLPGVLKSIFDEVGRLTGWTFLIIGSGPNLDAPTGQIQTLSWNYGDSLNGVPFTGAYEYFMEDIYTPFSQFCAKYTFAAMDVCESQLVEPLHRTSKAVPSSSATLEPGSSTSDPRPSPSPSKVNPISQPTPITGTSPERVPIDTITSPDPIPIPVPATASVPPSALTQDLEPVSTLPFCTKSEAGPLSTGTNLLLLPELGTMPIVDNPFNDPLDYQPVIRGELTAMLFGDTDGTTGPEYNYVSQQSVVTSPRQSLSSSQIPFTYPLPQTSTGVFPTTISSAELGGTPHNTPPVVDESKASGKGKRGSKKKQTRSRAHGKTGKENIDGPSTTTTPSSDPSPPSDPPSSTSDSASPLEHPPAKKSTKRHLEVDSQAAEPVELPSKRRRAAPSRQPMTYEQILKRRNGEAAEEVITKKGRRK
ncbi:hypothetical protein VKT23_009952 [Stygiomarasmius scandens]|uniref:Uncharacterized protein n=1 Tax=Marasmiellus scandens TaxID=2682957 RepID=A0ABR1JD94_9AGAR